MTERHRFVAESSELEIFIYGSISSWNISARYIADLLRNFPNAKTIKLRVNSLGGSVFEGAAIHNILSRHPAKKEVDIDGVAASAASWIVMAGDVRRIGLNGFFMIHEAAGFTDGPAIDHEKTASLLRKMNAQQIDIYAKCSNLSRADLAKAVEAETWYTGEEALKAGFVTATSSALDSSSAAHAEATEHKAEHLDDYAFKNAPVDQLVKFFSFAASPRRERIPTAALELLESQQPPARAPSTEPTGDAETMNKKLLAQKLGLAENAPDEAFEAAIVKLADDNALMRASVAKLEALAGDGKTGDAAFGGLNAAVLAAKRVPELEAKLQKLEGVAEATELDTAIAEGVKASKVSKAINDALRAQYAAKQITLEGVKATIASLPPIKALMASGDGKEGAGPKGAPSSGSDDETLKHNGKAYAEMSGRELATLKKNEPELYEQMRDAARPRTR